MANGDGLAQTNHYRNESDLTDPRGRSFDPAGPVGASPMHGQPPDFDENPLTLIIQQDADKPVENIGIERADGSLVIRLDGRRMPKEPSGSAKEHDANLAEFIDNTELARICDELLNGIDADLQTRQEWLDRRAAGIKHLALK